MSAPADRTWFPARLGMTATVAALVGVTGIIAAVIAAHPSGASGKAPPQSSAAIAKAIAAPSIA
ncbi:MAG: hypothetical protein ACRDNW_20305, partial [Trebonia sp.]